ncbi:MAG: DUF4214 domain-containing protein, partial [Pirellulales bacterium]
YTPPGNFPGYDDAQYSAKDGQGDQATATVIVLSQTGGVVWKFYEQVLHRDPDYLPEAQGGGGLGYWINELLLHRDPSGNIQPGLIVAGFAESTELLTPIIQGWYEQYLGRAADAGGLQYYINEWRHDGGPEESQRDFFVSPEFHALAQNDYGSHDDFPDEYWVWGLYERILNRAPDAKGLQDWQQQLENGIPETQVALDFFTSPEAFDNDVTGWYYEYLGRAPSLTEQAQYVNQMTAGASDQTIEQEITSLPEYVDGPPAPQPGTAERFRLPPYSPQTAAVAAKDALFDELGQ